MLGAHLRHKESTRTEVEASSEQLVDEVRWIVRDGVAAPGDVLIGACDNEFAAGGRLRFAFGNIDDCEWYAVGAHRLSQRRYRYIRIITQKRVARPERIIDRPAVGELRERKPASRRRGRREIRHRKARLFGAVIGDDRGAIVEIAEVEAGAA